MSSSSKHPAIAVVGVSALFPGSTGSKSFWTNILRGEDLISDIPETHWLPEDYYDADPSAPDKTYAKRGGFLPQIDFDAMHWGVPPSIIEATDTSQLLALIVAEQVLKDAAKGQFETMDRSRISCILGVTSGQELFGTMVSRLQRPVWQKSLREHGVAESDVDAICQRIADHYVPWQESSFPGLLGNVVAGRIANRLDLGGTNCVTDAACASTFSALSMAVQELYLGDSDMVITGGVDALSDIFMYMCFSKTPALSASGDCRPFSDQADGTMLGEGLGMVALKRLADAERDGDAIYAVVSGVGSSSDGRSKSVYAPVSAGQAKAIERAYDNAGFSPQSVELIEAHGTGTKAGDVAEFGGLALIFGERKEGDEPWCALGTVKSQIGHTKSAAGAAGLFKAVMALHHKVLPPTIKVDAPNPKLGLDTSALYLNTVARPWIRGSAHPRRAGVSSFGFGGSNFHLALEEYRGQSPKADRLRSLSGELVALSAADGASLAAAAKEMAKEAKTPGALQALAWRSAKQFQASAAARLAVVASDDADLAAKLSRLAALIAADPKTPFTHPDGSAFGLGAAKGDVAFIFPGQGSQYVNMGADLAMAFDAARQPWDASADLDLAAQRRIDQMVFPPPRFSDEERNKDSVALRATEWAQPAIGTASLSQLAMMKALGITPAAVAGHSFGEITALHASGVLSQDDMLRVARRRGELMAAASELSGAMCAVSATVERVGELLKSLGRDDVVIANHNAPTQVVISGATDAIEAAESMMKSDGLRFKRLPVATAFHSPVVASSEKPFGEYLAQVDFGDSNLSVWSGESAAPYEVDAGDKKRRLARQIANPVRFVDLISNMADSGIHTFIEVGPGSVLTALVGRSLKGREHLAVTLDRQSNDGLSSFLRGCASLLAAGIDMDLMALWQGYAQPEAVDIKPGKRLMISICGANTNKPYPPKGGAAALPGPNPPEAVTLKTPSALDLPVAAAPLAPAAAQASPAAAMPEGWLAAWQVTMAQNAATHAAFQQSMAQSHVAYLQAMQASISALAGLAGGQAPGPIAAAAPMMTMPLPMPVVAPAAAPVMAYAPVATPVPEPTAPVQATPMAAPPTPQPVATSNNDLQAIMLDIVADKTGYPAEMLDPSMNMEGDLGIDSIKRVEILSAVQDRIPGLPEVDAGAMAALQTLAEIIDYFRGLTGASGQSSQEPTAAPTGSVSKPALQAIMLDIVAEKTGYPAEMLDPSMNMEGDLGIDSIKRVEILSAVQDRIPGLPEVDAGAMAALQTLAEIIDYFRTLTGGDEQPSQAPASSAGDMQAIMLEIVADKTGYPAEMLDPSMNMEGDLGIDSIKRVEILSAVQDRLPGLPPVDAGAMAALQTLAEIIDYFRGLLGEPGKPEATTPILSVVAAVPQPNDLGRYALEMQPSPACGMAQPGLLGAASVFVCGSDLAPALAKELQRRGVAAQAVATPPADAESVVYLGGLRAVADADEAIEITRDAYAIARNLAPRLSQSTGLFVSVQDTGGSFGMTPFEPERAFLAGLPALIKTAAQEWPQASLKAIDLSCEERTPKAQAKLLADELLLGGGEVEVAIDSDGLRLVPRSVRTLVKSGEARIAKGDVVVVSGGARGVTAACIIEWAQRSQARFLLLGRSELVDEPSCCAGLTTDAELKRALLGLANGSMPSPAELGKNVRNVLAGREIRQTLAAIERAGGEARYRVASVTEAQSIESVFAETRADWGPIKALVHGAGVLADRKIAEQTDAQFDLVFNTKVEGLRVLLTALKADPLKVICMFSSVSARCGNNGQSTYAIANEVLNKVALAQARLRGDEVLVKSLGWGPWEGGMVTDQLKAHFARLGVPMIPLDIGARMFADEMQSVQLEQVELVLGGEPRAEALLVEGSDSRKLSLEVAVNAKSHAYLAGHRIANEVVLPVAVALEWFTRVARTFRPDLYFTSIRDLKVLKGLLVRNFEEEGERLAVQCRQLDDSLLELQLRGLDGVLYYSAQALMSADPVEAFDADKLPPLSLRAWNGDPIYGDVLFHEDEFQVIQGLDGVGEAGISGHMKGVHAAEWAWERWDTDVAAMDGGLQMVLLWARKAMGGAVLPMGIGEAILAELPPQGTIRCVARCRADSKTSGSADVAFHNEAGIRFAELKDVRVILRPNA
jgi:acyl transferase domain-containing protein/short-subunit dehydrogenase